MQVRAGGGAGSGVWETAGPARGRTLKGIRTKKIRAVRFVKALNFSAMVQTAQGAEHADAPAREEEVVIMERILDEDELPPEETPGAIEGFEAGSYAGSPVHDVESGRT